MAGELTSVAVVFGGPSPEHEVSVLTGLQAARALAGSGALASVYALFWSKTGEWFRVDPGLEASAFGAGTPAGAQDLQLVAGPDGGFIERRGRIGGRTQRLEFDAAIICCHGGPGEDGTLQGALDLAGVAYAGPSAAGAALGMDKYSSAAVLAAAGLPVLERLLVSETMAAPSAPGPYIVKPRYGGSSIGIEVVEDVATARALTRSSIHLRRGAVLEAYRPELFDLEVAVRTWPETELSAIARPIRTGAGEILDYADKYVPNEGMAAAPRELPAQVPAALENALRAAALTAATALGARGVNRIDFLSDGAAYFVNEINTIPGSLARYLFCNPPVAFTELLLDLSREAVARPAVEFSSAGGSALVLRDATTIAAKLA